MAITLYEIIASDTISQFADKVNYNFDQFLQNGGGPAGPTGPQGPFGPTGPQGIIGPQGVRGSKWFQGSTYPVSGINTGELFLNTDGLVYEYNGTSWVSTGINLTGTGNVWDQLDGSSTNISPSLPLYAFRYLRPSYSYSTSSGGNSNEQAVLIGGAPYGAAADQSIGGTEVDYISNTYASDINTENASLFIHAPKELGIGKNIILSRIKGDNISSYNTDIVDDMSYITLDLADGISIIGQTRVNNSSIFNDYPNGISLGSPDSKTYIGSGRNILIETYNPITGYDTNIFGPDNSVGNITLHAKQSTLSGYAGAALTLKKGITSPYGDAIIVLGNSDPTATPTANDSSIYIRNSGTSHDISLFSGRSIVTTSGKSFAINTPGTSNIALDVRGNTVSSQLISIKKNNSVESFGLSSTGKLTQALAFPSSGVNSTDPNSLDYYEEGSWTPILSVFNPSSISGTFGTSGTSNYSVKKARYTRIGNTLIIDAVFNITIPSSLECPETPNFYQSGLIVTGFPYQPDIEKSSVAVSINTEYGMPFYSAGANEIAGNCSTIPIAGSVKASFYCASTSGSALAFYVNDADLAFDGIAYKNMRRLSFIDYQGSTDGILNFSANYMITSNIDGNPCSGATSGAGSGVGYSIISQAQAPASPNTLVVADSPNSLTWNTVSTLSRSLPGTSVSTSSNLNESIYYRATLTNNTLGTSTWFQGYTWEITGATTSASPISTSLLSTAGSGSSVTWEAPSPWVSGKKYIWEGKFGIIPTFVQVGNAETFPNFRVQTFSVGEDISVGNTFYFYNPFSVTLVVVVSYTVQAGDTPYDVVNELRDLINATTEETWNISGGAPLGNPYFPPTATSNSFGFGDSGRNVSITLNYYNQFTGGVSIYPF